MVLTVVLDLKVIAAIRIALSLWCHANILETMARPIGNYLNCELEWQRLSKKVIESLSKLPVPKKIEQLITTYVTSIESKVDEWVSYHHKRIWFCLIEKSTLYNHFHDLIWCSDGSIDDEQSARNLLMSPRLSEIEKYRILCTYCLEDEIKNNISPVLFKKNLVDYVQFYDHPMIFYWNCYFRGELQKVPAGDHTSIESAMLRSVDNWSAIQYFFDRLKHNEKIEASVYLIKKFGIRYQKILLLKLTHVQKQSVFMKQAVKVLKNYSISANFSEDVRSIWFDIRNLVTTDQFTKMIIYLLRGNTSNAVITEVWINASIDLKSFALCYKQYKVIKEVIKRCQWSDDYEFLLIILPDLSPKVIGEILRSDYFNAYCEELIVKDRISLLNRVLRLCCASANENMAEIKKQFIINSNSIRNRCLEYYEAGEVTKLNNLLAHYLSWSRGVISEYKKQLLLSPEGGQACVCHLNSGKNTLSEIISDCSLGDEQITRFKRVVLFTPKCIQMFRTWFISDRFEDVKKYIDLYLKLDSDKKSLKMKLLDPLEPLVSFAFKKYDEKWWDSFLFWCFGNEDDIHNFKSTLPISCVFIEMLRNVIFKWYDPRHRVTYCRYRRDFSFTEINRFLRWYYGNPDDVKRFKISQVNNYYDIDFMNTLLHKKDTKYIKAVMEWFFDKDVLQIAQFKSKLKNSRIAEMI